MRKMLINTNGWLGFSADGITRWHLTSPFRATIRPWNSFAHMPTKSDYIVCLCTHTSSEVQLWVGKLYFDKLEEKMQKWHHRIRRQNRNLIGNENGIHEKLHAELRLLTLNDPNRPRNRRSSWLTPVQYIRISMTRCNFSVPICNVPNAQDFDAHGDMSFLLGKEQNKWNLQCQEQSQMKAVGTRLKTHVSVYWLD